MNNPENNNQFNSESGQYVHNSQIKENGPNHMSQSVHPGAPNVHPDNLGQVGAGQIGHPDHLDHFNHAEQVGANNAQVSYENGAYYRNQVQTKPVHNHIINPWVLKICIFVLSALGILAMFLPFVSVDIFTYSESLYLFKTGDSFGDGVIYAVLLLIIIVLTAFNKRLISLITSILTALGFSITLNNLYTNAGDYAEMLNPQAGFFLACLSIYGLVVVTLIQTIFSHVEKKATMESTNRAALMNSNPSGEVNAHENKFNQNFNNSVLNERVQNNANPDERTAPCCKMNGERPCFEESNEVNHENLTENAQATKVNETLERNETSNEE